LFYQFLGISAEPLLVKIAAILTGIVVMVCVLVIGVGVRNMGKYRESADDGR
jgi:hypothetical protein